MENRNILIGITGSIAAYKICSLVSSLSKQGYNVKVIETKHATAFIPPLTLAALSHHDVYTDEFNGENEAMIPHIALTKWADVFCIAPADANILAKAATGIADDLLSSAILACNKPILVAPAMNVHMYENPATQANLNTLRLRGWQVIEPESGVLACQDTGKGRLADLTTIEQAIINLLKQQNSDQDLLANKKVVISAGPTVESLDPVRFLSNHSTGKQGYAIARAAQKMGADVVLVSGPVHLEKPQGVRLIPVVDARQMEEAMKQESHDADFVIMAAAVADFRFKETFDQKMKKENDRDTISFELVKNPDILASLGANKKPGQVLCGFAMETENLDHNARAKLEKKNCDLLVANNLNTEGAGFGTDTNVVSLLLKDSTQHLGMQNKEELGRTILKTMLQLQKGQA